MSQNYPRNYSEWYHNDLTSRLAQQIGVLRFWGDIYTKPSAVGAFRTWFFFKHTIFCRFFSEKWSNLQNLKTGEQHFLQKMPGQSMVSDSGGEMLRREANLIKQTLLMPFFGTQSIEPLDQLMKFKLNMFFFLNFYRWVNAEPLKICSFP